MFTGIRFYHQVIPIYNRSISGKSRHVQAAASSGLNNGNIMAKGFLGNGTDMVGPNER